MMEICGASFIEIGEIEDKNGTLFARIRVDWRLVPRNIMQKDGSDWIIGKISEKMLDEDGRRLVRREWEERHRPTVSE